jgi:glycosyltransferase involved in cell wall biosynthesis
LKISVLTACLNAERTIGHTLESFLAQTHPDKELLILDGGSSDRTLDVVGSFPSDEVSVFSEADEGMYDALNRGLERYRGDAVGCLNADDRYADRTVLAELAASLGRTDMVSGNLDYVRDHESGTVVRRWRGTHRPKGGFRSGWMPAHPTFYVRRKVAEEVGMFDDSYRTAADYDWMLRAHELHSFRSDHLDRTLVHMQAGGRSTSGVGSYLRHNLEALKSRRRWLNSGLVDYALVAKPLRKVRQFASNPQ